MMYFDLLEIPFEMQGLLSSASVIGEMNFVKTKESQLVSDPVAFGNIHFSTCHELCLHNIGKHGTIAVCNMQYGIWDTKHHWFCSRPSRDLNEDDTASTGEEMSL